MTKTIVGKKNIQSDHCYRCGRLMIPESVFEIGSIDWHCISCGERIDRVILAHRQAQGLKDLTCEEAGRLFTWKGKARLN